MGRCLLINSIIQFCSYDLDAYTDHLARHPLQLLQQLRGCGGSAGSIGSAVGSVGGGVGGGGGSVGSAGEATAAEAELAAALTDAAQLGPGLVKGVGISLAATGAPAGAPGAESGGEDAAAGVGKLPSVAFPLALSNPIPLHVGCRAHLLKPGSSPTPLAATKGNTTAGSEGCDTEQQRKARVLIVGGGDGWVAKQLISCYGDWVSSVYAVDIDKAVSDVTQAFFGSNSSSSVNPFKHPMIHWEYTDAFSWALKRAASCGESSSSIGSQGSCSAFDIVIIDSTDFTEDAATHLHSAPFYKALYQLMNPKGALVQLMEIYLRSFEEPFARIGGVLREAGWTGVGRSSVYTPSYGGETIFLHAVKV